MRSTSFSRQILMQLDFCNFSRHIFEKSSNMKFHKYFFRASRAVPCGQTGKWTDRYYKATSRFPQCSSRTETTVSTEEVPESRSSHFIPKDRFRTTHCMGECVDLRVSLDLFEYRKVSCPRWKSKDVSSAVQHVT